MEGEFSAGQIPSLISTETLWDELLADAASTIPSPSKSSTTTPHGVEPAAALTGGLKAPDPVPSSTLTVAEPESVVIRSRMSSPLKSAAATEDGPEPAV